MLTKIIMPSGGQTTNESLIVKWHKKVGDDIKRGEAFFDIETDKATLEVESYGEGTILAIYHNEGEYVSTGDIVAYIGAHGEKLPEDGIKATNAGERASNDSDDEYQQIMKKKDINKKDENVPDVKPVPSHPDKLLASPAARKLAADSGISLKEIAGRTFGQPVKRADVEQYLAGEREKDAQDYYLIDASPMRKIIAVRMVESISVAPHFTVSVDIDMTEAISLRQFLNEHLKNDGVKVSFNDIIIKCASKAIEKYPMINSTFDREKIKVYKNVNFGLAVGIENGLVVPVVKETNRKSIPEIALLNKANIEKAKAGRLQQSDMTGGTITLSNLGMYGVKCFTAIINQPESCILAIGSIEERAVAVNGQLAVKHMLTVTASFDHRVIDGTVGAAFLKEMKELLEKP